MSSKEVRQTLIDSVKKDLMGPEEIEETIDRVPTEKYITGAIYPTIIDDETPSEIDEANEVSDEEEEPHSNLQQPRSMGFSCVIDSKINPSDLSIKLSGAIYRESNKIWNRIPISSNSHFLNLDGSKLRIIFGTKKNKGELNLADLNECNLESKSQISLKWETSPLSEASHHLSLFLVNGATSEKKFKASRTLYQCYINLSTGDNYGILSRPRRRISQENDIQSLDYLYSSNSEFAVGHSTSVNWDSSNYSDTSIVGEKTSNLKDNLHPSDSSKCRAVETTFFPQYNSRGLELIFQGDDAPNLNMFNLSDLEYLNGNEGNKANNVLEMGKLANGYEDWIHSTFSVTNHDFSDTIERHSKNAKLSLQRIREGINLLDTNETAYQAFCLMNRAIWLQFVNKKQSNENKDKENFFFSPDSKWESVASWYPFQLGFILQNLNSVFNANHDDRQLVDLLWVRTGGGKTEAYLGLLSFVMFTNRLRRANKSTRKIIQFDGGGKGPSLPSKGYYRYGLFGQEKYKTFKQPSGPSNSALDYACLLASLKDISEEGNCEEYKLEIYSKNENLIKQLNEVNKVGDKFKRDYNEIKGIASKFKSVNYVWRSTETPLDMTDLGCEVMMRYTLRLLTLQQFQRATRLIMACEYMRIVERYPILDGCKRFTIGLYIGGTSTPNRVKETNVHRNDYDTFNSQSKKDKNQNKALQRTAEYALTRWKKEKELPETSNPFQILECPWCNQKLQPKDHKIDFVNDNFRMVTRCGNRTCDFNKNPMPYQTIDQTMYESPPSLLIGTVDKFAQLTFNTEVGALFGWRGGKRTLDPPNLIIQDELHLINGPLGSLTGLYEATIDYLSSDHIEAELDSIQSLHELMPSDFEIKISQRPKIIASTATIRNADKQCMALYDRKTFRFPPSGINVDDSYFVKTRDDNIKDKSYIGILCSGVGSKTTIKNVSSTILSDIANQKKEGSQLRDYDPFWTIVSYYNSMRELGGSITLMRDDIRTNVQDVRPSMKDDTSIGELHGGLNSRDLPQVLDRLQQNAEDKSPYDILTCTNMFSVGVDVDRLGLMMMNSQPKATTEYLQSTGRVGRGTDSLVLVLFNQARPRDQSHFEYFYDYHSRIQLHVESMTLTPFSEGTVERALHAQYVIFLRQAFDETGFEIRNEPECINFDETLQVHKKTLGFCAYLMQRAESCTGSENTYEYLKDKFLEFQEKWIRRTKYSQEHPVVPIPNTDKVSSKFRYRGWDRWPGTVTPRLLEQDPASDWLDREKVRNMTPPFEYPAILTPSSLRNVEEEVELLKHYWRKKDER